MTMSVVRLLPDDDPRAKRIPRIMGEIDIASRHGYAHERYMMAVVLRMMPWQVRAPIKSVFCDSKASWSVTITLHSWDASEAEAIGCLFESGMVEENHGHNGILVTDGSDDHRYFIEPHWESAA